MDEDSQRKSALFSHLIMQQSNMALMLMGKVAHPESGQVMQDLESARLFIDQIEVLEEKTKGNLTKEEAGLMKQILMNLRMSFVEAVQSTPPSAEPAASKSESAAPSPESTAKASSEPASTEEEHRKKFSKKY
jgi:hypothetical protein